MAMFNSVFLNLDKLLGVLGERKSQKGFIVTALSAIALKYFPDFPKESFSNIVDSVLQLISLVGSIWLSIGVVHQWVKDQILKFGLIPPSVVKRAEETGLPQVVTKFR